MTSSPQSTGLARSRILLEILLTILLIVTTVVVLWKLMHEPSGSPPTLARNVRPTPRPEPPPPAEPLAIAGAATKGSAAAKTVLVEYSDFQCPYCGRFARETLPAVERQYVATGKARLVFEELPLDMHPFALGAAVAAECAGEQGHFWGMHDALFADQTHLDGTALRARAAALRLDLKRFDDCVTNPATTVAVKQSAAAAKALSVTGTPSFFLGTVQADGRVKVTKRFTGALDVQAFGTAIDAAAAGGAGAVATKR